MVAPQHIRDVLAGPHIKTLIHDGDTTVVMAEPLYFVPFKMTVECELCRSTRSYGCKHSRCPLSPAIAAQAAL